MILFLANTLAGCDGGSRAGADILHGILAPQRKVAVVCNDRCFVPREIDGQSIPTVRWLVPPPASISPLHRSKTARAMLKGILKNWRDTVLRVRFDRALTKISPVLTVHNGFPVPGSMNSAILDRATRRLIIVHSSPDARSYFQRRIPELTGEWVAEHLRRADSLVFVSPQIRDAWLGIANLEHIPRYVVANTTREEEAEPLRRMSRLEVRRRLNIPKNAFMVCCVGKVDTAKGQDVLVRALPRLVARVPRLHVVFVGVITPFAQKLPGEIEAMGLGGHVTFVGGRDDAYAFIRAADLLIHPSRAEGHPLVILEAMVLKTPILATDVGGIPFSVKHGQSGWLVPPNDPESLVAGFTTLMDTPSLMHRLAEQAEVRYWTHFSRKKHRESIQYVIAEALAHQNNAPV